MSADLKLQQTDGDSGGWTCPSCGETMPHGAVLCISCGYDKRTGRRIGDRKAPLLSPAWIIKAALGLGLIASAIYIAVDKLQPAPPPAPPPKPAAIPPTNAAANVVSAAATNAAAAVTTNATGMVTTSGVPVVATNELIDLDPEREQRTRAALTQRVDQRFPLYMKGETVAFRLANGNVRRGTFVGLSASNAVLTVGSNETARIPLGTLDMATRLRADPDYRVRYVDYWSQRGIKRSAGPE